MENASRREFLLTASAAALAAAKPGFATNMPTAFPPPPHRRVFVGTGSPDGILAFDFETATGKLTPSGVAAKVGNAGWVAYSIGLKYVFAALATDSFNGKATGAVASFLVQGPRLNQLSAQNSAGAGTCHLALDYTGRALISADYNGGSAASYRVGRAS